MSKKADGRIIIDTELNIDDLKKDVINAERELKKLQATEDKLNKKAEAAQARSDKIRAKYDTDDTNAAFRKKFEKQYGSYESAKDKEEWGANFDKGYIASLANEHDDFAASLRLMKDTYNELTDAESNTKAAQEALNAAQQKYDSYVNKMNNPFVVFLNSAQKAAIGLTKVLGKGLISAVKKTGRAFVSGAKNIMSFGAKTAKAINPLDGMMKKVSRLGTLMKLMITRRLIMAMINQAKEGINNLAGYSSSFNSTMSSLKSNVTYVGNALATAFAPILSAIAPIVDTITDSIVNLINMLAQLTARLTGTATMFTRAKKAQVDYGNATNSSTKAQDKQVASFDTLQKLSSGSSSDGSGANASDMFEEAQIDSEIINLADKIKENVANGDWYSVGMIVGEQLSKALDSIQWGPIQNQAASIGMNVANLINGFVEFPDLGYKIGNSIAQGLNTALAFAYAFVTTMHWDSIGKFVGDAITGFFQNVNWAQFGSVIGTFVGGLIQALGNVMIKTDFTAIANAINFFAHSLLNSIADKISSVNWLEAGAALAKGIASIDFEQIAFDFVNLIGTAIMGMVDLIKGFFNELGINSIEGLLEGMFSLIINIGAWIAENIIAPLIDAFCDLLGIHSPSTVFAEIGSNIMQGLLNGLGSLLGDVGQFFSEMWNDVTDSVGQFASDWGTAIGSWWDKDVSPWFTLDKWAELGGNIVNGIKNGVAGIGKIAVGIGGSLIQSAKDALDIHSPSGEFEYLGSFLMPGLAQGIDKTTQSVLDALSNAIKKMQELWQKGFQTEGSYSVYFFDQGKKMMTGLINAFKTMMKSLDDQLKMLLQLVQTTMNEAAAAARSAASSIQSSVSSAISAMERLESMESGSISSRMSRFSSVPETFSIPHLATGTVVSPNNPFMAMLGDNKQEQEIVSPLSTMKQALQEVLAESGMNRNITVVMEYNGREFGRAVYEANNKETQRVGLKLAKGGKF